MRASRLTGLVMVAALAAACSTLTPAQDRSLDEVRVFADETARHYGLAPIHVLVSHNPESPVGSYRRGFFAVNRLVLGSEFRDAIVAHELAHYVLGHDVPLAGATAEARRRDRERRELDANATAVEILIAVKRIPEDQALRMVYSYLLNVHRRLQRSPSEDLLGHRPPCEEIADLLARFPRQLVWAGRLECAPTRTGLGRWTGPRTPWYKDPSSLRARGAAWLAHWTVNPEVAGSSPVEPAK